MEDHRFNQLDRLSSRLQTALKTQDSIGIQKLAILLEDLCWVLSSDLKLAEKEMENLRDAL